VNQPTIVTGVISLGVLLFFTLRLSRQIAPRHFAKSVTSILLFIAFTTFYVALSQLDGVSLLRSVTLLFGPFFLFFELSQVEASEDGR